MTQAQLPAVDAGSWEPTKRLDKDLKAAARLLGVTSVRHLTDRYYQIQDFRKIADNQVRASGESLEPNRILAWVFEENEKLENNIKRSLDVFTSEYKVGNWMKSIIGIGPVIAAGMLANLDIRTAPTVGHWWRFAGYDPTRIWLGRAKSDAIVNKVLGDRKEAAHQDLLQIVREVNQSSVYLTHDPDGNALDLDTMPPRGWTLGELQAKLVKSIKKKGDNPNAKKNIAAVLAKCPWNAKLKCLCFKMGDVFVKFSGHEEEYYGTIYNQRKEYEQYRNERGLYAWQARHALEQKNYRTDTVARKSYEEGKLPPGRIHMRSLRYASKMFLSHLHHVMHLDYYDTEPPKPFGMEQAPGDHRHFVPIPNFPYDGPGKSLKELYEKP